MKLNGIVLIVLVCFIIGLFLGVTIGEGAVSAPTVTIEVGISDDDVSALDIAFIIANPNQRAVNLTGLEYYCEIYEEYTVGEHLEEEWNFFGLGLPIQSVPPLGTVTIKRKIAITRGIPLKRFLQDGFINISLKGNLSAKIDNESYEIPFEKITTVYLESDVREAKQALCPDITGIELKTSKLEHSNGAVTEVIINQSIIITNPNPTTICLDILNYDLYYKKEDNWVRLSSGFAGGGTIEPLGSYRKSMKLRESDDEVIQFILSGNITQIKIRGSMFTYPKERGWQPSYFEPSFERVVTTVNGSGVWGEVTPKSTSTPKPSATPTPVHTTGVPEEPGFEAVVTLMGLLAVAYRVKRKS